MFSRLILACLFLFGINAFALTDEEADQKILNDCLSYKERVNKRIIDTIVGLGGTYTGSFNIGNCVKTSFHGGAPYMALQLPGEIYSTDFSDSGKTVPLKFGAVRDQGWIDDVEFAFWWIKKPIYNHLGNIVGHEYKFYYQDYSTRDDSYVGPNRYYYSVRNAETDHRVCRIDIN